MKRSTWGWIAAAAAATVAVVAVVYEERKHSSSSPTPGPTSGPTVTVPLSVPSGGGQGNLGIVAVPANASLIILAPQGGGVTGLSGNAPAMSVASQAPGAVSLQWSQQGATANLTIQWNDPTGAAQVSTLQVVQDVPAAFVTLSPGTMPNLILPLEAGQMLFAPPSGGSVQGGSLSSSGVVTGTLIAPQAAAPQGGYAVVANTAGNTVLTVDWTDATGTAQTSTIAVNVTPS
jgi:hypothetical protein